eukprot:gnl/TRDRNA2_/TRDRNA2_177052_c0_seq5.p2 gnl/TRDRNA2_/TRDRNA2_177052_c0~~gnl/TRDRNA2_/TRDRNA2_177052_c0_seq5.p2  ORF type:complete len:117 (-),score=0.59 gnl/TRDRNA2_/TRDRNA2_177052_c0_seq5:46-396(-)
MERTLEREAVLHIQPFQTFAGHPVPSEATLAQSSVFQDRHYTIPFTAAQSYTRPRQEIPKGWAIPNAEGQPHKSKIKPCETKDFHPGLLQANQSLAKQCWRIQARSPVATAGHLPT